MPYAYLEGLRLYFEEYGEGTPVVFLHGFTLDHRMWWQQAEYFDQWYRVLLLDAKGHGLSASPETGYSRDDRVEDLKRFLDHMKVDKFHLVGLSMGGSTAIGFALKYPERLLSMTLVSSGAAGYSVGKKINKLDELARDHGVAAAKKKWKEWSLAWYKDGKEDFRHLMEQMIDDHEGAIWRDPMRGKYPKTVDLDNVQKIKVPTKIIAGQFDKVWVKLAEALHEKIAGSSLSVYEGVGHMVNLEAPERFNEEVKAFLESVGSV